MQDRLRKLELTTVKKLDVQKRFLFLIYLLVRFPHMFPGSSGIMCSLSKDRTHKRLARTDHRIL